MKNKKLILLAFILIALGSATWFWTQKHDPSDVKEQTVTPSQGTIEQVVTAQGKLEPKEYVDVGAQVSGQLKKLYVEIGDFVHQGDPIAEIDDRIYQARVEGDEAALKTLRAQLAEQEAQVQYARQQVDRNERLIKVKAVSKQILENVQTELAVAQARTGSLQAQIEQAETTLEADKTNLGFTKIFAPIDGTVVVQTSREGQTLNANQTAPVIVQLANLDTMTVRAQVAEADVMSLKPDMEVYFTVLGNQARKWHGKTRQILPSPEIVNEVVLYNVLVDVDNSDHQLMTGMTTQMSFVLGRAENVMTLPVSAIVKPLPDKTNDKGEAQLVRVRQGKNAIEKIIHTGLATRTQIEVRDGLNADDQVILPMEETKAQAGPRGFGPRI